MNQQKKKKKEASLRGRLMRDMISNITATASIGTKIQNGEYRKHPIEPEWKCPDGYEHTIIPMNKFKMELTRSLTRDSGRVILQLHGGAYIGPMKNIYRKFAIQYIEESFGAKVLTVDYRIAPQDPYPAALYDALAAYEWLLAQGYTGRDIVVAGDSAGGGLALCVCLYLRDHGMPMPKGIITMSAWTDLTLSGASYESNYEKDPLFGNTTESMIYNREYLGNHNPKDPYISPLFGEYMGFPPMLMQVGSYEMLLSDTVAVARKAKMQRVKVKLSIYEGMFHEFQMAGALLPECKKAWKEIGKFLVKIEKGV